jgi:RimJ/RimL family protein N-acetyltransferase
VIKANPDLLTYVPFPVIDTEADFMKAFYDNIDKNFGNSPGDCLYAIFDKVTAPGIENTHSNYAGILSLNATNPVNAVTEIGVIIFPEFQRTQVATNSIGLMLLCMDA